MDDIGGIPDPFERTEFVNAADYQDMPEQVPGKHLWCVTVAFRLDDPTQAQMVGSGELLMVSRVGCFWCLEIYQGHPTETCPGKPS